MRVRRLHFHFHLCLVLLFALTAAGLGTSVKNQSESFGLGVENQSVRCIAAERRALLDFKKRLTVVENRLVSWTSEEEECCNWIGVGCDNSTGHVVKLDLDAMFTTGEIGSSLLELKHLSYLDLFSNHFHKIPDFIGSLSELTYLALSGNSFTGFIPHQLGNLSRLLCLDFSRNSLSSFIPISFDNMPALQRINFEGNNLEGGIPKSLGNICNLKELNLNDNKISGSLGVVIKNLTLPDLSILSSLRKLSLSGNQLEGPLPVSIGKMSQLVLLDPIYLILPNYKSFNSFSFNSSSDWIPQFKLDYIDMRSCSLGPQFPSWLRWQTTFSYLDISRSNINDASPDWFLNILPSSLNYLNLSSNKISGSIPNLPLKFGGFPLIDLSSNLFHGLIPLFFSNSMVLDLSNNMFSGPLSFLCTTTINIGLNYLDLSNNLLSGEILDCWNKYMILTAINLENNDLSGIIPNSLGSLQTLESLRLRNTSLYGEIPQSLENCTALKLQDLGDNKLTGIIPPWIGERLNGLNVLRLRSNEFHGNIPSTLCRQQLLQHLLVVWKGFEREYGNTLGLLKSIDLSCNKLSGKIPRELASLQGLINLNLSRNMLRGSIIREISQLKSLDSLDLSTNNLSGEIPESMSELSFLSMLDFSNNNLSGKIPSSTQLQSFNATSYSGNPGLCGEPLRKCPGGEPPKMPNNGGNEGDEGLFEPLWFFIGMIIEFLIGFWGIFGSLMINRSWRYKYFQLVSKLTDWIKLTMALMMVKLQRKLRLKE
ncbi:hypothetical protein ES332_A08G227800v1 [Gossypium tomentosum]|uniref:Uncharacterized protein n=1 Tax=Gossypium tomentosum TaxID=34277 RepID=A0A5D2PJ36_GOSTO|nr:hypothetical protein ES332_A08G227800v1 [Gossypium tomentosum]